MEALARIWSYAHKVVSQRNGGPNAFFVNQVVESYGCNLVEGVLSHQLKQFIIDANKCVLNKPSPEAKVGDVTTLSLANLCRVHHNVACGHGI